MTSDPTPDASNPEMVITHHESNNKGRYEARLDEVPEPAELTYSRMSAAAIIADHTSVPDALRGRGVGKALVERLVADAREGGYRIVPLCPYVNALYARHPEWSDVMQ